MKVSVITVCYNAVAHIEETIRSVMVQDHADIEHIVIDGGSNDGTQEKVKRYAECIAHFVSGKDNGVYDAMNKGLRLATGEVVAFVNAGDMIATRNTVGYMVRAFDEQDADVIYGDALMVDPDDITKVKRFWKAVLTGARISAKAGCRRTWAPTSGGARTTASATSTRS